MKVSIIVPMFNESKYIDEFFTRLLNQTTRADEIIICDNLSTDDSVSKVKDWSRRYPELNIILTEEKRKGGCKYPTQKAFDVSSGDIILKTDFDAEVPITWVKNYIDIFNSDERLMATSGVWFSSDGKWYHKGLYLIVHGFTSILFKFPFRYKFLFGPNSGYRRTALKLVDGWVDYEGLPTGWTEDLTISKKFELHRLKTSYHYRLIIKHSSRNIQRKWGLWYFVKNQFRNEEYKLRK